MSDRRERTKAWRAVQALAASATLAVVLPTCGASGTPAPDLDASQKPQPSQCQPLRQMMPHFFAMLDDPTQPLAGLKAVVLRLTAGDTTGDDVVSRLMSSAVRGLKAFTADPPESQDARCLPEAPQAPLCTLDAAPGQACENRMCALRRALDFGIRDEAGKTALDDLQPILVKVLGYIANEGPGADGKTHYEVIDVFHRTSSADLEGICAPENLLQVLDDVVTFFRPSPACGDACPGPKALAAIQALVDDPALQPFLNDFQSQGTDGQGRQAWQNLFRGMSAGLESIDDQTIENMVGLLDKFLDSNPGKYGSIESELNEVEKSVLALFDANGGAILPPLRQVIVCLDHVDLQNEDIVGAVYDLLSERGGPAGNGLDLRDLVDAVNQILSLDSKGVLFGALHAVLESTERDAEARDDVRQALSDLLTDQNAHDAIPTIQAMLQQGVFDEVVRVLDNLLYGCTVDSN